MYYTTHLPRAPTLTTHPHNHPAIYLPLTHGSNLFSNWCVVLFV